ncbi:MAG: LicD family protein [Salinivirgaceae bacterium]|nr:LicD family protein [Salinivirgaceae bacterium]
MSGVSESINSAELKAKYNPEGSVFRQSQQAALEILIEFDRVCRSNNLQYWLSYGTLLGAVRHGGFIPWDDDVDVSMPAEDYKKFIEIGASQLENGYFLQTEKNEPQSGVGRGIFKIRKDNTFYINDFDVFTTDYHRGIFIDVFEAVEYPTLAKPAFRFFLNWFQKCFGFFHYNRPLTLMNIIRYFVFPVIYAALKIVFKLICIARSKDRIFSPMERLTYGYPTLKTDMFPLSEVEFEGHKFYAPGNPDAYLKNIYGDYMKMPPKEQWRIHAKFICPDLSQCHHNL